MLSLPSALASRCVGSGAARGLYSTPVRGCKRLPPASRPDPSSLGSLLVHNQRGHSLGLDGRTTPAAGSVELAQQVSSMGRGTSWDGQAGLSLGSEPPLCHEDSTAASSHRSSSCFHSRYLQRNEDWGGEGVASAQGGLSDFSSPLSTFCRWKHE